MTIVFKTLAINIPRMKYFKNKYYKIRLKVKALRILPTPETGHFATDHYSHARPLVALCDSSGSGTAFMSVNFISLLSGEQVCQHFP